MKVFDDMQYAPVSRVAARDGGHAGTVTSRTKHCPSEEKTYEVLLDDETEKVKRTFHENELCLAPLPGAREAEAETAVRRAVRSRHVVREAVYEALGLGVYEIAEVVWPEPDDVPQDWTPAQLVAAVRELKDEARRLGAANMDPYADERARIAGIVVAVLHEMKEKP